ncbi:MAG: hypothetical protein R6X09_00680 [Bacteroidales bacterium]
MSKRIDFIATMIIVFLGSAHTALTPILAKEFNSPPADFAAIGLVFIFLGLINLVRNKTSLKLTNTVCLAANLLGLAWLCFSAFNENKIEVQGIIPFVALCYLTVQSAISLKQNQKNHAINNLNKLMQDENKDCV